MKRGGELRRSKPLVAKTGLARRTPLSPGTPITTSGGKLRRAPIKDSASSGRDPRPKTRKPKTQDGFSPETREAMYVRCGGRCEACGGPMQRRGFHAHHRQKRRGGDHSLANGVATHPTCHVVAPEAIHQRPAWAVERGLIVRTGQSPVEVPLMLPGGQLVLLDQDEPRYIPVEAAD